MAVSEAVASTKQQPGLAAGTLGLWGQLFQAITHMAPAAGIVFSTQYMASQGGASHALAYVLATVACTLSALCLKELVKKVRSAGGYFVIHSVALGDAAGFTTSWLYFIYDPVIVAAGSLLWPTILTNYLRTYLGVEPQIIEDGPGGNPFHFTVLFHVADVASIDQDRIKRIIEEEKPAHSTYTLKVDKALAPLPR